MTRARYAIGAGGASLALALAGVAAAAGGSAPQQAVIKQSTSLKMKANRYIQDGLRWDKDVYQVKSGGTVKIITTVASEGPHTFTIVAKKDLPRTGAQVNNCKVCESLGKAHGVDPNSDAPPKFQYLENGTGQDTAPNVDRAGDSGVTGSGKKGESITMKVTAKKGSTLTFMCLIHPWMQAKLLVR